MPQSDLEQQLKDERAAREQADKGNVAAHKSFRRRIEDLEKQCEQAELRLAEALDVLQLLRDYQNGCPLPKYEKHWNEAMDRSQVVIDNHTPPPLLAELTGLRINLEAMTLAHKIASGSADKECQSKVNAEQELAALKLKLDVAKAFITDRCPCQCADGYQCLKHEALSQLNDTAMVDSRMEVALNCLRLIGRATCETEMLTGRKCSHVQAHPRCQTCLANDALSQLNESK